MCDGSACIRGITTIDTEVLMGGKRPDQHNIDPAEAGSTDYKFRGEGRSQGESLKNEEKRHQKQTETDDLRRVMNSNPTNTAPGMAAADASKGRSVEKGTDEESTRDRVDEQSEESFPASDPPQQP